MVVNSAMLSMKNKISCFKSYATSKRKDVCSFSETYDFFRKASSLFSLDPFKTLGEPMGCVQIRDPGPPAPYLPNLILLGSFSDTLPVVSILDIVCDCYL